MNITRHLSKAIVLYCDNTVAIAYTKDPKYHGKTKYIDTRYHYIRDIIAQGLVVLKYISTTDTLADPFTKPTARNAFQKHIRGLGLLRI